MNTLYFWEDPDKVCKEVYRLLRNGGYFILSFNPLEEVNLAAYPKDLFTFYSIAEIESIVKKNQFKLLSSISIDDSIEKYVCLVLQK